MYKHFSQESFFSKLEHSIYFKTRLEHFIHFSTQLTTTTKKKVLFLESCRYWQSTWLKRTYYEKISKVKLKSSSTELAQNYSTINTAFRQEETVNFITALCRWYYFPLIFPCRYWIFASQKITSDLPLYLNHPQLKIA